MKQRKWNPLRALSGVPIYYRVIVANSVMALTVIATLLLFQTAMVAGVVVVACGMTNALLVRAAFQVDQQTRKQRQLLAWTLNESEKERSQLAYELQENAAQRLAALLLKVKGDPAVSGEAAAVMQDLCATAQTLQPPTIGLLGLNGALKWYAQSVQQRLGMQLDVTADESVVFLDRSLALAIYRMVQDVVETAAADAPKRIDVSVTTTGTLLHVSVDVPRILTQAEHFRVAERAALLGGQLRMSHHDKQAFVNITIPMEAEPSHGRYDSRLAG
jgi:signal transduction histidine kinase